MESDFDPAGRWDSFVAKCGNFKRRPGAKPVRRRDEYEGLCWAPSWIGESPDHFPRRLGSYLDGTDWDQARKADLDLDATFPSDGLPYAVVVEGKWHQRDDWCWFPSVHEVTDRIVFADDWRSHFEALVRGMREDALLTLVDCHG